MEDVPVELDPELARWQAVWHAQQVIAEDLAQRVKRDTRRMQWGVVAEFLVTLLMGGGSVGWAIVSRRTDVAVLAVGIWLVIAIAWTISLVLRRGAWQPSTATAAAFVEISILRCERRLQGIVAQAILFGPILAFDLVWLYVARQESSVWTFLARPLVVAIAGGGTLVAGGAALWYRRRLRRELNRLVMLRAELEAI